MASLLVTVLVAGAAGMLAGLLICRRWCGQQRHDEVPAVEPGIAAYVDEAAETWGQEAGDPVAARLVARKLKLGMALQQQRRSRLHRWWSRW